MKIDFNKISFKEVIKYILFLGIACTLLYFSFKGIKWEDFYNGLKDCTWEWIVLSMIIGLLGFVIRAIRWNLLLKEIEPNCSTSSAYQGVTIGNLANFVIPRMGEIVRCSVVSHKHKISLEGGIGSVIVERILDLICLFILAIFIFFFNNKFSTFIKEIFNSNNGNGWLKIILVLIAISLLLFIVIFLIIITKKYEPKNRFLKKILSIFLRFKEGITTIFRMKRKWSFLILTISLWGSFLATSIFTLKGFNTLSELNIVDALFLMIIGSFGWVIPVQGGIGAYHFIVSSALIQVYGAEQSQAIVFATISHESQALIMIISGIFSFFIFSLNKNSNE